MSWIFFSSASLIIFFTGFKFWEERRRKTSRLSKFLSDQDYRVERLIMKFIVLYRALRRSVRFVLFVRMPFFLHRIFRKTTYKVRDGYGRGKDYLRGKYGSKQRKRTSSHYLKEISKGRGNNFPDYGSGREGGDTPVTSEVKEAVQKDEVDLQISLGELPGMPDIPLATTKEKVFLEEEVIVNVPPDIPPSPVVRTNHDHAIEKNISEKTNDSKNIENKTSIRRVRRPHKKTEIPQTKSKSKSKETKPRFHSKDKKKIIKVVSLEENGQIEDGGLI